MSRNREHSIGALRGTEAAKYLGVGKTKFTEIVNGGKIPFTVVGNERAKLYRISDLDEFLRPKTTIEKIMQPLVEAIKKEYGYGEK